MSLNIDSLPFSCFHALRHPAVPNSKQVPILHAFFPNILTGREALNHQQFPVYILDLIWKTLNYMRSTLLMGIRHNVKGYSEALKTQCENHHVQRLWKGLALVMRATAVRSI